MDSVSSSATTTGASNASGAIAGLAAGKDANLSKVNFDTFLKLLVAQLKNQDPLNPLDGTQFTAQIAQFSSLEQQINGNNYLKDILAQRDFGEQTLANSYLGKQVLGPGNLFAKTGGSTQLGYEVNAGARQVTLEIIDNQTGQTLRTINGDAAEGIKTLNWDGKTDAGEQAPESAYTLRVRATDEEGKVIPSQGYVYSQVNSVLKNGTEVALQLADGRAITAASVIGVRN